MSLGSPVAPAPPAATRVARSGWRDLRLWIGVLLVTGSVVLGARLLAAVDDTVTVWAVAEDQGIGSPLTEDDLVAVRVRFDDEADLGRYFGAEEAVPSDAVLVRAVGAGELLPRAALGPGEEAGLLHVPLEVAPHLVPPAVAAGSVVDVYLTDAGRRSGPDDGRALESVTVVDAPSVEDTFAVTGTRQLVVAVREDVAEEFMGALGRMQDPVVQILQRS
ncbi:MAG TPA: hypothetical protein VD859_09795 [Nocardioides sp.]|nr:hypothetical protein [Nocardioides sp.]